MADKKTRKLSPKVLQKDIEALDALDAIENYTPSNPEYSKENAAAVKKATTASETKFVQDDAQMNASRDAMVAKQWERHDFVIGMRTQVEAQFGENSDQVAAVGRKKKSDYKSPKNRIPKP